MSTRKSIFDFNMLIFILHSINFISIGEFNVRR